MSINYCFQIVLSVLLTIPEGIPKIDRIGKDFLYARNQERYVCRDLYLMEHADAKSLINVPFGKW